VLSEGSLRARLWPPPRRDAAALGFGLAFLVFGTAGLLRSAGMHVDARWLSPLILISLGVAGLFSLLSRRRAAQLEPRDLEP
jgi:ABC-type antimicrobial peptide transport system permease subunit